MFLKKNQQGTSPRAPLFCLIYEIRRMNPIKDLMWKPLHPGEMVVVGDALRYQREGRRGESADDVYEVVKEDQHYFEIRLKPPGAPDTRKFIRYIDVGYNFQFERWSAG